MGKMMDSFRAWWNSIADSMGDPGKLAQLSVADLEAAVLRAKEAAAPVIGRPEALKDSVADLEEMDRALTWRITALVNSGEAGQEAARRYVGQQVAVRKQLADTQAALADATEAASEWLARIRVLEHELYARRNDADRLQAEFASARAEQQLGRQLRTADSLAGTGADTFSLLKARVEKEKARAAGYAKMSGLSERADEEQLISRYETDQLMLEYLTKIKK